MYPSRAGGGAARGRPVGDPGDRAGLPGCADAARSPAAVDGVARSRDSDPHSRPAPGSRTHRWRTPCRTPPRGTAPCATPRLWPSPLHAAPAAPCEEAAWRDGGDRPTGVGVRRRASRWAAITRTHDSRRRRDRSRATGASLAGQPVRSLADAPIAGSRTAASRAFLAPPRPAAARRPRIRCLPRPAATAASRPAGAGPAPGAAARAAGGPILVPAQVRVRVPAQVRCHRHHRGVSAPPPPPSPGGVRQSRRRTINP